MAKLYVSKSVRELMQEYKEPEPKPKYHNGNYAYYKKITEPIKRICKKCGKEFEQPRRTKFDAGAYFEYCPECRDNRKNTKVRKNTICLFCGKPLPTFRKGHNHLAFCGESCQLNYTINFYRQRNANLKAREVFSEVKP